MSNRFAPFVVALEEHYWDLDLVAHFPGREGKRLSQVEERLQDITNLRIKEMDEAGIDVVLGNWRGVFGAPAITTAQRDALVSAVKAATETSMWKETLAKFGKEQSIRTEFRSRSLVEVPADLETLAYRLVQVDRSLHDAAGRRHDAQDGLARHALPTPALAHDAQRLAATDGKRAAVDGAHRALMQHEVGFEILDFDERVVVHLLTLVIVSTGPPRHAAHHP